jgi:hypothetical protein
VPLDVADTGTSTTTSERRLSERPSKLMSAQRRECEVGIVPDGRNRRSVAKEVVWLLPGRPCTFFMLCMLARQNHGAPYDSPTPTQLHLATKDLASSLERSAMMGAFARCAQLRGAPNRRP